MKKRILAIFMAMVMALSLSVTAFAATTRRRRSDHYSSRRHVRE